MWLLRLSRDYMQGGEISPVSLLLSSCLRTRPAQHACLGHRQQGAMPRCCECPLDEPCSGMQILAGKDLLWQGNLPQSLKLFTRDELEQALLQGSTAGDGEAEGTGELCLDVSDSCHRNRTLTGQILIPVRLVTKSTM